MASTYIDPAVRAQLANVHDVFVIARHEKHGYLLLLNKGALGKEFKIPSGKFEHPGIGGDSNYKAASNAASCKMLVQTGLVIAPCRFNRILFPAQVQEKLGNRVFYEVWISDQDSVVKGGETALTGHGLVVSGKSDKCPTHFGDLNTASMNAGDDIPHSCPGGCLLYIVEVGHVWTCYLPYLPCQENRTFMFAQTTMVLRFTKIFAMPPQPCGAPAELRPPRCWQRMPYTVRPAAWGE